MEYKLNDPVKMGNPRESESYMDYMNRTIKDLMKLDDKSFGIQIVKKSYAKIARDCLDSDDQLYLKFATRSVKYLWDFFIEVDNKEDFINAMVDISNEWIDSDDIDFQDYILEMRDLLREKIGLDLAISD